MAGFATYDKGGGVPGTTVYADNYDFTGVTRTNTVTTNGQLPIGSTVANAGGNHINVGTIVSPNATLAIGYSSPNITMDLVGNIPDLHTAKWIVNQSSGQGGNSTTIQNAINNAVSGETIAIFPGTYTENITLKAGVNLTAWGSDSSLNGTGKVIINGTCTMTTAGSVTIFGIQLQTNSAALLAVTGSAASIVNLNNCYLNCTNATGITFSSSNASAQVNLTNCFGDIGTTGISFFTHSSAGSLSIIDNNISNSGATTTASTCSAGVLIIQKCGLTFPITTSGTSQTTFANCNFDTNAQNVTVMTVGGSGVIQLARYCRFAGGTASAISIGSSLVMDFCEVNSSNSNALTGAGVLTGNTIHYTGSSSANNVTTKTMQPLGILGTWTPNIQVNGSNTGITYTTQTGKYVQIGNVVFISALITLSNNGAGVGSVTISNLPVLAGDSNQDIPTGWSNITITGNTLVSMQFNAASSVGNFVLHPITGAASLLANTNMTTTSQFKFNGFYFAS